MYTDYECGLCGRPVPRAETQCAQCDARLNDPTALAGALTAGLEVPRQRSSGKLWPFGSSHSDRSSELTATQRWFVDTQASIDDKTLKRWLTAAEPAGLFNVETGTAAVANRLGRSCEDCWITNGVYRPCVTCGRGPDNTLACGSGSGDGVYLVWSGEAAATAIAVAAFAQNEEGPLELDTFIKLLAGAAPLVLGEIETLGGLVFADASPYTEVVAPCPPGTYVVVAWIGPIAAFGSPGVEVLRPLALMAIAGEGAEQIRKASSRAPQPDVREAMADICNPMYTVSAHIQPISESDMCEGNNLILRDVESAGDAAIAWGIRNVLLDRGSAQAQELLNESDPAVLLTCAWALAAIGAESDAFELMQLAATRGSEIAGLMLQRWHAARAAGRDLFHAWGITNLMVANDRGAASALAGDVAHGMDLLLCSAALGFPSGASWYTFLSLLAGTEQDGLDAYKATLPACEEGVRNRQEHGARDPELRNSLEFQEFLTFDAYQLANARSNAALLEVALGHRPEHALAAWAESANVGHVESKFYPAMVAARSGNAAQLAPAIAALSPADRADLLETLRDGASRSASGTWASRWFADCVKAIESDGRLAPDSISQTNAAPVAAQARFCTNCGAARGEGRFCTQCGQPLS